MSPETSHVRAILVALGLAMVPHAARLPIWTIGWCLACWGYCGLGISRRWPRPPRWGQIVLCVAGTIGVALTYEGDINREAAVALLAIMAALKPFEIRSHRDRMFSLMLAYFMVITCLLFSNALGMTLYMLISVFVTTVVLIGVIHPQGHLRRRIRVAAQLVGLSIPLTIVLFLLFPRFQGSLVGIRQSHTAVSGFSDALSPGTVTRLVPNDDIVFRVQFDDPIPPVSQRYWRGVVFTRFDGRSWHKIHTRPAPRNVPPGTRIIHYTVTLEPHAQKWLFALDLPLSAPPLTTLYTDRTITAPFSIRRQVHYAMRSAPDLPHNRLYINPRRLIALPAEGNPGARRLAQQWAREAESPRQVVDRALSFLSAGGFGYTFNPPALGAHPVDELLFDTRKGYCEHYASAFAFLMRAAAIPARIVGGYLGGEVNPYGNYLIVRQSEAHVWVEVWIAPRGWVRVDPTTVVAPGRLARGALAALSASEKVLIAAEPRWGFAQGYLKKAQLAWDALDNLWLRAVVRYSFENQKGLLKRIGLRITSWKNYLHYFAVAMVVLAGLLMALAIRAVGFKQAARDPEQRAYQQYCSRLNTVGLPRESAWGPVDYAHRVIKKGPT